MANSSFTSSTVSYSEPYTEERELEIYKSIMKNLQDIRQATRDINVTFKSVQEKMGITAALVNAIETKAPAVSRD